MVGGVLAIQLLGDMAVAMGQEQRSLPKSKKTRAFLAYLVLADRALQRERMSQVFWEQTEDPKAALRWTLSKLRNVLNDSGVERLRSDARTVSFDGTACQVDVRELREAARRGFSECPRETLERWHHALTGGFLVGLELPECEAYQAWLVSMRDELAPAAELLQRLLGKGSSAPKGQERPAVAVLPFDNLSGSDDDQYFADGLAEDLITALSQWRSFPVIARNSSFTYRGKSQRAERIGLELGARYLVEGSVRRAGTRVRIHVKVLDADSGHHLWAQRFDRDLSDVFAVQDEITECVVHAIAPELQRAEWTRVASKRTADLTAWDYYIRGLEVFHHDDRETNEQARAMFEQATEHDPDYAEAWAQLAWTYVLDIHLRIAPSREEAAGKAIELANHALALDANSASAHLCLGSAYVWREELEKGLAQARRALELNPNYAHAAMALGNRLDLLGQSEAGIEQMKVSLRLNPRDPNRWHYWGYLARAYASLGDCETALCWARESIELRPDDADMHFRAALCLANLDRVDEARKALDRCNELEADFLASASDWKPYSDDARNQEIFSGVRRHRLLAETTA